MDESLASSLVIILALLPSLICQQQPSCTAPGQLSCDAGCRNLVLCLGDDYDGFLEEVVEACSPDSSTNPTFCYIPDARCSSEQNSCTEPSREFECSGVGLFPDPYSCHYYYVCGTDDGEVKGTRYPCDPADRGFSSLRGICNLDGQSQVCRFNQVPRCTEAGQSGLTLENPNYYYICKRKDGILYPVVYQCPRGEPFNDGTKRCEPL